MRWPPPETTSRIAVVIAAIPLAVTTASSDRSSAESLPARTVWFGRLFSRRYRTSS